MRSSLEEQVKASHFVVVVVKQLKPWNMLFYHARLERLLVNCFQSSGMELKNTNGISGTGGNQCKILNPVMVGRTTLKLLPTSFGSYGRLKMNGPSII